MIIVSTFNHRRRIAGPLSHLMNAESYLVRTLAELQDDLKAPLSRVAERQSIFLVNAFYNCRSRESPPAIVSRNVFECIRQNNE